MHGYNWTINSPRIVRVQKPSKAEPATGIIEANRDEKDTPAWYAIIPPFDIPAEVAVNDGYDGGE